MNMYTMCYLPNLTGKPEGHLEHLEVDEKSFTLAKWGVFIACSVGEGHSLYKVVMGKQFMWEPMVSESTRGI